MKQSESNACGTERGHLEGNGLSSEGQAVYSLLTAQDENEAESALHHLHPTMQERLSALCLAR